MNVCGLGMNVAAALVLVAYPFVVRSTFYIDFVTEILMFAIAAMGLNVLLGYTGLASLGHAAFFGIGAYTAGLVSLHLSPLLPLTLLAAVALATSTALMVGIIALRATGIYFIFLTLALAQAVFAVGFKWRWLTGGSDGLVGIPRPSLGATLDAVVSLNTAAGFYCVAALAFGGSYLALQCIIRSPFGSVLVSIRENAERASAIGYNVGRYKLASFVLSGGIAGLAGALYAHFNRLVAPDQLSWQTSALLMMMVIVGGAGTLPGPVVGAAVLLFLQNIVSTYTDRWPMIMGVTFIIFVLAGRNGIWGVVTRSLRREHHS